VNPACGCGPLVQEKVFIQVAKQSGNAAAASMPHRRAWFHAGVQATHIGQLEG